MDRLERFTSPLLIPLPPSQPQKVRIPNRKPEGWVSVTPRSTSARFSSIANQRISSSGARAPVDEPPGDGMDEPTVGRTAIGDRNVPGEWTIKAERDTGDVGKMGVASGMEQAPALTQDVLSTPQTDRAPPEESTTSRQRIPRGKGRVVSGTMQYALLPPSPHPTPPKISTSTETFEHAHVPSSPQQPSPSSPSKRKYLTSEPSSTASPRSDQILTPLPGVDFFPSHPKYPTTTHPTPLSSLGSTLSDLRGDEATAIYHVLPQAALTDDSADADQSLQSVSEADFSLRADGSVDDEVSRPEWIEEVLAEREADEEWMGYVRGQLNALFPDFFAEDQNKFGYGTDLTHGHGYETGQIVSGQHGYLPDPVQAGRRAVNAIPLPGVRSELGELREEIERLRGVVGGLAEGLASGQALAMDEGEKAVRKGDRRGTGKREREEVEILADSAVVLDGVSQRGVGQLLLQNPDHIVSLIRKLDARFDLGRQSEKTTGELLGRENLEGLIRRLG